ncbi:prolipoprotein diacylglyceryl transferase [candidate division WWE3 bacterium]|nr:prolipoprotein diacylglyceryl transferase [candidate division WWE3 bacterium]
MIIGALYLFSFIFGLFLVWKLGRDDYYDEEKLIDLVLFSTTFGLLLARFSYFLTSAGRDELTSISTSPNLWLGIAQFFQLSNGNLWWMGLIGFLGMVGFLIWRWNWPHWPMLGYVVLATAVSVCASELLTWYFDGLMYRGIVLGSGVLIVGIMIWAIRFGGEQRFKDMMSGFQEGYVKRLETLKSSHGAENTKNNSLVDKLNHSGESKNDIPQTASSPIAHITFKTIDQTEKK